MKIAATLALLIVLGGCTIAYTPDTLRVTDQTQFQADLAFCTQAAANWQPQASISDIGESGFEGGAGMLSYTPINPLIPALGAAGEAGKTAASQFNLNGIAKRNVAKNCVYDTTHQDGSAILARPED